MFISLMNTTINPTPESCSEGILEQSPIKGLSGEAPESQSKATDGAQLASSQVTEYQQ